MSMESRESGVNRKGKPAGLLPELKVSITTVG